jgi:uncharacterized membrane protein YdbT with pleckstrin-like domain
MTYIDHVLATDESVLNRSKLHWVIYVSPELFAALGLALATVAPSSGAPEVTVAFLIFGGMFTLVGFMGCLIAWIKRVTTEIAVTTHRVILKRGLVWRATTELNANKIEPVHVDQSVAGRLLNFGTVTTRGTGSGLEPLRQVAAPLKLRAANSQLQRAS